MAKQRDPVLDSMRGIGIVLMVLGHSGFPGTGFIYLFHMALFFMLSGWLFSLRGGLVHFAKRKVVTLWLPFVLACVLGSAITFAATALTFRFFLQRQRSKDAGLTETAQAEEL